MTFFHTQENRDKELTKPAFCSKENAWIGEAFYFWENEDDANFWGIKFKKKTGQYDIYTAEILTDNILDTVFNREHYYFWLKQIEKAAKYFVKRTGTKPTLKEINDFFREKQIWTEIDGILFQDISKNPVHFLVKEFQYKKRIQLALYDSEKITNFALHYTGECN
ncbi:MAG: hypothetical protein PF487_12385 [Bacteroidales bacterium]|jgi:hypothetical protein|nr:hypothetical protein [Bacteroidales bacterium]